MQHKVSIIGTGYVGLVTGTCLADFGLEVTCIDHDEKKIDKLIHGVMPIYEPGLDVLVQKNVEQGRLKFSTDIKSGVQEAGVIFLAVGTPPQEDGSADLQYVDSASKDIGRYMNGYKVIVNKSTVPIGTGQRVRKTIKENLSQDMEFDVVSNPEFLREGSAVKDFLHPDRIIIGSDSQKATEIIKDVYRVLYLNEVPFVTTNLETAELIKYASNSFLAVKISFINEIANLCEKVGANITDVAIGMGKDGRIGSKFLHPGPGYGGSCFPKDTLALAKTGQVLSSPITIVEAAIKANENQKSRMVDKIVSGVGNIQGKTVGILGLAFKPETDDARESPAIKIIHELAGRGAKLRVYDPKAMEECKWRLEHIKDIVFCENEYQVVSQSSAVVIATEWNQFRNLELKRIRELMLEPNFFDLRNIYEPEKVREMGFKYFCVGKVMR